MGHYWEFDYALWATAVNLVVHYRPLWHIWLSAKGLCAKWGYTVTICDGFHTMGHSTGFGYGLWARATVQSLIILCGPLCRICSVGHCAEFHYALWGYSIKPILIALNYWTVFQKLASPYPIKGQWCLTLIQAAGGVYDFRNFEQVWLHNALSNEKF